MRQSTFFERYREIIAGAIMFGIAAVYLYHIQFIQVRSQVRVTAKLIPEILGGLLIVLAVLQSVRGVKYLLDTRRENAEKAIPTTFMSQEEKQGLWPVALTFVIIIGYAAVFTRLGFIVSSTICMFLQMLVLIPKNKMRPGLFFVVSLIAALAAYLAFRRGLNLTLPQGILEGAPLLN